MALSDVDWARLEQQFKDTREEIGRVHGRITEHAIEDQRMFSTVATTISQGFVTHKDKDHNWGKLFAVLSSIVVVAGAVIGGVLWLIERAGK
jgi:hypothetical protein